MQIKIIIALLVLLPLVVFAKPTKTVELEIKETPVSELSINEQIDHYAALYGTEGSLIKKIVECESGGKVDAQGDFKKANGIAQFWESTFYRMAKILGEELDYNSSHDQIKLLSFAISKPELAREWTSYRAIKNGGTYTFYWKQYGKTITVHCKL